ncbi:hypothetical protein HYR54_15340 [Candidatus Acetothermia bacterium]|nr:hypothetical protein [Candidatus Acetothermia bacterium]
MSWFPIGPDFVFAPRNENFKRLSRRNEVGRQGLVSNIAIDPNDPATIYVVERPSSGGSSAFRMRTEGGIEGASWVPIADSLQQLDPTVDPSCIAVNPDPARSNIIYMGTWSNMGFYVSTTRGDTWGTRNAISGNVLKIIVDPRTASNPATTVLYAATTTGVYRSPDGGTTWTQVLAGGVWSLAAYIPATGTPHFYASIWQSGIFHTTNPSAPGNWTNLNTQGIGLPAHTASTITEPNGNFDAILVDLCPRNPNRVYAWMSKISCDTMGRNCQQITAALYTTSSPLTVWTPVAMTPAPGDTLPPGPGQGLYSFALGIAPNSPGNGANDILFFASTPLYRSTDGGQTWQMDAIGYHADQHAFAFFPENPAAGVISAFYIGCDGGIAMSSKFCDPAFSISTAATDFDEGLNYSDLGVYQNYNHGKQSSAVYQYASDPTIAALGYIGCQDTGVGAGSGAFGWRGIADADGGAIAAARGVNGVNVWGILGAFCDWPGFRITSWTDKGEFSPASRFVTLGAGGSLLAGTTNYVVGLDGHCLAGAAVRNSTTLNSAITTTGSQAATPASMASIVVGSVLAVGDDPCSDPNREYVTVTAVTASTFTANFTKTHPAGTNIRIELDHNMVTRIDGTGSVSQISQDFGSSNQVSIVAAHPTNPNILYCATRDQKLWMTNNGSTASSSTVWTEIAGGKPSFLTMSSIAIDNAGNVYVLLKSSVITGGGEVSTTSPLFKIAGGNWIHQSCTNLPPPIPNILGFGKLLADPVQPNVLYASHDARVYRLTLTAGSWVWQDISDGLPGQWIYDLWIGNVGSSGSPKVLLRTAIPTRGIWERDVTAGATDPPIALYVRDNLVDQGWLNPSPEGMPNPYDPTDNVWHYQCADIKIDAQQPGSGAVSPFYQTDPEGSTPPITHVLFDQLNDNSQNLPQMDMAWVHVQVHNRSRTLANNIRVWAIYCNASGGVPALSASPSLGNAFPFWSQFIVTGQIIPNLPADSPWKSVGLPQTLSGIDAMSPKVASWLWTIPTLPSGDPGHYCIMVFIHSATSPSNETNMDANQVARTNRQVGQKNLHIGPPLPPSPSQGGGAGGAGGQPRAQVMEEYVEFHNPTTTPREASLVFDLRRLPSELAVSFKLTRLNTVNPLHSSVSGVAKIRQPGIIEQISAWLGFMLRWLGWLIQWLGCWIENLGRRILGLPLKSCRFEPDVKLPDFESTIYEAEPSALVEIKGVRLPAFGFVAALLSIRNTGTLEEGSENRFEAQQLVKGEVVGGSTYVVRIAGARKFPPIIVADSQRTDLDLRTLERIEREAEEIRYVPPWAKDIVETREKEQGKKI